MGDQMTAVIVSLRSFPDTRLYVQGDQKGQPVWGRWFLTGPKGRPGYLEGPISHAVVSALAASRSIVPDVTDEYGRAHTYRLSPA